MASRRTSTQDAFDRFIATAEGFDYLTGPLLEQRSVDLFRRFDAGEELTVIAAAQVLGLPLDVFRHAWADYITTLCLAMGEPESARPQ